MPLDNIQHGVMPVGDEVFFWFRIRKNNIQQGKNFVVDPSFGKTDIGGSTHSAPLNDSKYGCIYSLSEDGDVYKITYYGRATSGTQNMRAVIYNVTGTTINEWIGNSSEVSVNTTYAWREFTCSPSISLTSGDYALTMHNDDGATVQSKYSSGTSNQAQRQNADDDLYSNGPSDPFGTPAWSGARAVSIYANYTVSAGEDYVADLSQSVSTAWSVLTEWDAIADVSQSITTSWSVLTEWDAILDITQALTTSWNVLANLNTFVDLSQAIATTWVVLTQWNAILDLTQSLTTSWTVLTQTSFNVIASLSHTFTWLIDVIHTVGATAHIADLSQAITTAWTILTQTTFNINLAQTVGTTWTVLIQSTFNIATSLSNTFTWTVDIYHWVFTGFAYSVDLSLAILTSWTIDTLLTTTTLSSVAALAALGFILAIVAIAIAVTRKD